MRRGRQVRGGAEDAESDDTMTTVQEIKDAIQHLPAGEFSDLHDWIIEKDWEGWDAQIERDSEAGKLDFLIDEALGDKQSGNTGPL